MAFCRTSERARTRSLCTVTRVTEHIDELQENCMKRLLPLLLAGAIVTSLAYGTDQTADERFRIKYGRYSPLVEARNQAIARAAHEETPLCCRTASLSRTALQERLRAKLGRTTTGEEVRERSRRTDCSTRRELPRPRHMHPHG